MKKDDIKYCIVTEGADFNFPYLRVMLNSLLTHDNWVKDNIVIMTCDLTPLSSHNREILKSISDKIQFVNIDAKWFSNVEVKNQNRNQVLLSLYRLNCFNLKTFDVALYISSYSICVSSIKALFEGQSNLSLADTGMMAQSTRDPKQKILSSELNSSVMLISDSVMSGDIFKKSLENLDKIRRLTDRSIDQIIQDSLKLGGIDYSLLSLNLVVKKSRFPDSKFRNYQAIQTKVCIINVDSELSKTSNVHFMFKRINSIWNNYNIKINHHGETDQIDQSIHEYIYKSHLKEKVDIINSENNSIEIDEFKELKISDSIDTKSTIIIGSGRSCLDYNFGNIIDSFDKIVRFRGQISSGYHINVGSRTTELCFNDSPESINNIINEYIEIYQKSNISTFKVSHNRNRLARHSLRTTSALKKISNSQVDILDMSNIKHVIFKLCKKLNISFKTNVRITSGLSMIINKLYVENEDVVYIHGFDSLSDNADYVKSPFHYYDNDIELKDKLIRLHDLEFEKSIILSLIKMGRIINLKDVALSNRINPVSNSDFNDIVFLSVVDSNFMKGFTTLIYSLYENNPELKENLYVIVDAGLSEDDKNKIYKLIKNVIIKSVSFPINLKNSKHIDRLKSAYLKFDAYDNDQYERLVVLDCDMLVIKPLNPRDILNVPTHTISACRAQLSGKGKTNYLNSGFVIIPKGIAKKQRLISSVRLNNSNLADQGAVNEIFKNFNEFDKSYNVEKRIINESDYRLENVRIIHYVGEIKPWHSPIKREKKYLHVYSIWDKYNKKMNNYEK